MSDFEASDSESDYDENEKILLQNFRKKKQRDSDDESEEEIFNVGNLEEDSDDDIEIHDSDVEEQNEKDDLPDDKAWGKNKRTFYSTDYVDPDHGGFNEKDLEQAELEEEEARKLQKKLAQKLDDNDFSLEFLQDTPLSEDEIIEEKFKADASKLSKREKIQALKKECPELFSLMKDYKAKMSTYETFLNPVSNKFRKGQIINSLAMQFVQTFSDLILNYCTNIHMYLLLKAENVSIKEHPVVKRLYQYRQLIEKLEPVFDDIIKPQINVLLAEKEKSVEPKVKLKILQNIELSSADAAKTKKKKKKVKIVEEKLEDTQDQEVETVEMEENLIPIAENESEKRAITYQIAKNKGLTPHRKKEQRNPRVKHRNKFRKAKIRRKGAVREVRNELKRYGGEISGIKATVSKSIKLKA